MSKIFEFNPQKGYIDQVSGAVGVNTNGTIERTEKGLAWRGNGVDTNINIADVFTDYDTAFLSTSVFSIYGIFKASNVISQQQILAQRGGANRFVIGIQASTLRMSMYNGVFGESGVIEANKWYSFVLTSDSGTANLYLDEILQTGNDINVTHVSTLSMRIGSSTGQTFPFSGYIGKISFYDHLLTAKERAQLYSEFLRAGPISKSISVPLSYPKSNDISSEVGLVAGYNFTKGGNNTDISGQGFNDTTTGKVSLTKDGRYYSTNGKSVIGNIGNIKSIAFRIKLDSTTEKIMEGVANDKLIHVAAGILTYPEFDNAFIDGIDANVMVAGQWHNVVIVSSTDVDFSTCTLALNNATYGNFEIEGLKFYDYQFTEAHAQNYHNSFARRVQSKLELSDWGVGQDGPALSGSPIQVTSGTFSIQELSAQDVNVPQLEKGHQWLQCDTNGAFQIFYPGSTSVDAIIDYYNGTMWAREEDTLANLITNNAWLSQSGDYLIFTLTANDGIATELIKQGITQ